MQCLTVFCVFAYPCIGPKKSQPNSCTTHAEREWAGGTFLRQRKKVPPYHAQRSIIALLHGCYVLIDLQPPGMVSNFGNRQAMLNHFQHGLTITICFFFATGFWSAVHKKIQYAFVRANDDDDEKIITLAPPTNKNITINQLW